MSNPQPPLPFPARATDAHKGDFGRVLLIGGSRGMAGSIALSSMAALKTGAGLVSTAIPDRCLEVVAGFHPGIMTIPLEETREGCFELSASLPPLGKFDAIGCGPGMGTGPGSIRIVETILKHTPSLRVLDADAINILSEQQFLDCPALPSDQSTLILTPHPGELARLTGVSPDDREAQIAAAEERVEKHGLTIVVKGGPTVVVGMQAPDQRGKPRRAARFVNDTGNAGLATAGSGDVLTGVISSLLGQGLAPWDAARLGVFIHGLAGDLAAESHSQAGMTCLELLAYLPSAIKTIEPMVAASHPGVTAD